MGTLIAESNLVEVVNSTFGGFFKVLNRKVSQECTRSENIGGRTVKASLDESVIPSMKDLEKMLIKIAESSRTAKMRVMCFIGPFFTINTHIIAVREGDWALYLAMEEEMHYLLSMEVMPQDARIEFAAGNHTMHHKLGQLDGKGESLASPLNN